MLKHAGVSARELFPELLVDALPALTPVENAAGMELVRRRRDEYDQDVSFGARPFILRGLPIRRLPSKRSNTRAETDVFSSRSSDTRITASRSGRIDSCSFATNAVRHRTPVVRFSSAAEILAEWGLTTNGSHYHRLQHAFLRVFGSTICIPG